MTANVPGRQTVPRSELWAITCTTEAMENDSKYEAIIDTAGVIQGILKQKKNLYRHPNGDL